jgi:aspartyl-tRNA(Asn)/glutamyl-tRNA(Gln) amidotransferase subunit C
LLALPVRVLSFSTRAFVDGTLTQGTLDTAAPRSRRILAATLRLMPVEIDIEHVAKLARLELTDEEKARLRDQLGVILENAAKVSEVATDDVPPTAYAIPRSNVLRPDEITQSLTTEEVLSNAPEVEDDRFKVPKVVEVG